RPGERPRPVGRTLPLRRRLTTHPSAGGALRVARRVRLLARRVAGRRANYAPAMEAVPHGTSRATVTRLPEGVAETDRLAVEGPLEVPRDGRGVAGPVVT